MGVFRRQFTPFCAVTMLVSMSAQIAATALANAQFGSILSNQINRTVSGLQGASACQQLSNFVGPSGAVAGKKGSSDAAELASAASIPGECPMPGAVPSLPDCSEIEETYISKGVEKKQVSKVKKDMAIASLRSMKEAFDKAKSCEGKRKDAAEKKVASLKNVISQIKQQLAAQARAEIAAQDAYFKGQFEALNKQQQLFQQQSADINSQLQSVSEKLNGPLIDGKPSGGGLVGLQFELEGMVNQPIQKDSSAGGNSVIGSGGIRAQHLKLVELNQLVEERESVAASAEGYLKMALAMECFKNDNFGEYCWDAKKRRRYSCSSREKLVSFVTDQSAVADHNKKGHLDNKARAKMADQAETLTKVLDQIIADSPQNTDIPNLDQIGNDSASLLAYKNGFKSGRMLLTLDDVSKRAKAALSTIQIADSGLSADQFVMGRLNTCYSRATNTVAKEAKRADSPVFQNKRSNDRLKISLDNDLKRIKSTFSLRYDAAIQALNLNTTVFQRLQDIPVCKMSGRSSQENCLKEMENKVQGLLDGTNTLAKVNSSSFRLNIDRAKLDPSIRDFQCSGLNNCVKALSSVLGNLDIKAGHAKGQLDQFNLMAENKRRELQSGPGFVQGFVADAKNPNPRSFSSWLADARTRYGNTIGQMNLLAQQCGSTIAGAAGATMDTDPEKLFSKKSDSADVVFKETTGEVAVSGDNLEAMLKGSDGPIVLGEDAFKSISTKHAARVEKIDDAKKDLEKLQTDFAGSFSKTCTDTFKAENDHAPDSSNKSSENKAASTGDTSPSARALAAANSYANLMFSTLQKCQNRTKVNNSAPACTNDENPAFHTALSNGIAALNAMGLKSEGRAIASELNLLTPELESAFKKICNPTNVGQTVDYDCSAIEPKDRVEAGRSASQLQNEAGALK